MDRKLKKQYNRMIKIMDLLEELEVEYMPSVSIQQILHMEEYSKALNSNLKRSVNNTIKNLEKELQLINQEGFFDNLDN